MRTLGFLLVTVLAINGCGGPAGTSKDEAMDSNADNAVLSSLIDRVLRDMPFDVSPRYVNFRPRPQLKRDISAFVKRGGDRAVMAIREKLLVEDNPYVAIALLYMLGQSSSSSTGVAYEDYRVFLKSHDPFPTGFPGKEQVTAASPPINGLVPPGAQGTKK